jgi:hypothetical protein
MATLLPATARRRRCRSYHDDGPVFGRLSRSARSDRLRHQPLVAKAQALFMLTEVQAQAGDAGVFERESMALSERGHSPRRLPPRTTVLPGLRGESAQGPPRRVLAAFAHLRFNASGASRASRWHGPRYDLAHAAPRTGRRLNDVSRPPVMGVG